MSQNDSSSEHLKIMSFGQENTNSLETDDSK